jgi:hypothetical protein
MPAVRYDLLSTPRKAGGAAKNRPLQEKQMLSPHEFAVLMLVKASPEQTDVQREEFSALLEQQLVALESTPSGVHRPRVTNDGESLLRTLMQMR